MADDSGEAKMPSVEERLSFLEGKGEEHGRGLQDVREALFSLEQRVTLLDQRVTLLDEKMDRRFDAVDRRFEVLDQKMDQRFDALDKKIDTKIWSVVGIQIALLLAVIGALLR